MTQSNPNKTEASIAASQIGRNEVIQGVAAMPFFPVKDYTTFDAEYAMPGGDIVMHFSPSKEVIARGPQAASRFWHQTFARCIDAVASKIFEASFGDRLQAVFTHEPDLGIFENWFFKASGYGHLLDPHKKLYDFLDALDAALEEADKAQ